MLLEAGPDAPVTLVRVLGPVSVTVDGALRPLPSPAARAVFALLAVDAGRVVPVDRLLEELWGQDRPESRTGSLHAYVSRLRRALGDAVDLGEGRAPTPVRIRRRAPGYVLELPDGALDVWRLARRRDAARSRVATDPGGALELLDEALALVTGPPLVDVVDALGPVAEAEARRLGELVLDAREARVEALLGIGRPADAARDAERLLAEQPLRESVHGLRLLALYRSGRQAEALAGFEGVRVRLASELGVDPGPALRRLHTQLLQQDPSLDWVPVPGRVVGAATAPAAPEPSRPAARPGLFGRARELRLLDDAVDRARSGAGGVWVLSGEAGIGKTRLVAEVVRRAAAAGTAVARGQAQETAEAAPYWLWHGVLRELPEVPRGSEVEVVLGGARDGDALLTRARVHDALVRLLVERAAAGPPLLVVLEDVHWADEASLALLSVLAERVAEVPLLVLCTCRVEDTAPAGAVAALLARLARARQHSRLELGGLAPEHAHEMLVAHLGAEPDPALSAAAADRTGGNPFYLQELARLVRDADGSPDAWHQVPGTVRDVLLHRFEGLPPAARRLLDVAAVLGRECDLGLLEGASGLSGADVDDGLAAAVQSGLVAETSLPRPLLRFRHALVREALHDRAGARARMRLHAQVGQVMARRPDADVDALAAQLLAGGDLADPVAAVSAALRAADRAMAQLAHDHAQGLLERALPRLPAVDDRAERDRLELALQTRRGTVIATREGFAAPAAQAALERATALALRAEPGSDVLAALYRRFLFLLMGADYAAVRALAWDLLERASTADDDQVRDRFALLGHLSRGSVSWCMGDAEPAVDELVRALELAQTAGVGLPVAAFGDPAVRARMFLCHALASAGRTEDAVVVADEMVAAAHQSGPADESDALATRGMMYAAFGRPAPARADGVEGRRLGRLAGADLLAHFAMLNEGWGAAVEGGPGAAGAVEMARAATAGYRSTGTRMHDPIVFTMLAEAEASTGHPQEAATAAAEGLAALARTGSRLWQDRLRRLAQPAAERSRVERR